MKIKNEIYSIFFLKWNEDMRDLYINKLFEFGM